MFRPPEDVAPVLEANVAAFERMTQGWWENLYDGWNARKRGKLLAKSKSPGKALEIGPGRGAFIALLLNEGYRVEGVDISRGICVDLEERFGVRMAHGTLDGFEGGGPYDLIAAHHVVEHVQDVAGFLGRCRSLLSRGGRLLLSCPNQGSWSAGFSSWPGYEPYHCLFFTPVSLVRALGRAGLQVSFVRLRQPFTGWWNVLSRGLAGRRRAGRGDDVALKGTSRSVKSLYNVVRFAGSALLLPLTIVTAWISRGEEIVVLAEKTDGFSCEPAGGAVIEPGRSSR